jgi:NADH dehydrogenase (ubiquinone) 1 alpha subcomplex subunit 9
MVDSLHCAEIVLTRVTALKFEDLGVMPHKLKGYPTEYLISYRKGGPSFGSTVSEKTRSSEM